MRSLKNDPQDIAVIDKIRELEKLARLLEPPESRREIIRSRVVDYTEEFLNHIDTLPAFTTSADQGIGILDSPISDDTLSIDSALQLVHENLDVPGLNPASRGHLGYIPGGGIYYSALGDYIADVTNRYAGVFYAGTGAIRMEQMLIDWMASIAGFPKGTGGNLTSGGSIANLVGIVAARDATELKPKDIEQSAIYLTTQAHHSVDKAIRIAGLKHCVIRSVDMDVHHRMDPDALEQLILHDKEMGLHPWLVICTAGTTDTGAIDPLTAIADICQHHHLWMHTDGAYGGFFVLCEEGKTLLEGMSRSDSLVMDPHKGLFLPYGSGAVLVREQSRLFNAFWYQANYLQDAAAASGELSPADLSPELTKHFRGLRMWLPLKLLGIAPFRAALEEKLWLARYFYEEIRKVPRFEAGTYPDLSVVTFRYVPARGDADRFNERLLQEVVRDGRVFLSSTRLNGQFVIRVAVLCFRSHLDTIDLALSILKEKALLLESSL
ncbi:MAG TPA: aminotransferase class I/II-fold pyridoxal phosphate-dependent enzyme [Bacteroidota bacterium]|nr:aminotransferase class I/II-fold pyridoxal phosphate-dependent enzyme [Bacteroidota bacterium]